MSRILFQSVLLIGIIFGSDRKVFFNVSSTELHHIFLIFPIYISSQPPPSFRHLRDEMTPYRDSFLNYFNKAIRIPLRNIPTYKSQHIFIKSFQLLKAPLYRIGIFTIFSILIPESFDETGFVDDIHVAVNEQIKNFS